MIDDSISWLTSHPLQGVALLAGVAIGISLLLIRRLHDVAAHGPPRC